LLSVGNSSSDLGVRYGEARRSCRGSGCKHGRIARCADVVRLFQTVTVVERDVLPDDATNRRGVPWRAAWAKHHRRRYAHRSDDPIGMVEISVI
jgi:hypothetical protein